MQDGLVGYMSSDVHVDCRSVCAAIVYNYDTEPLQIAKRGSCIQVENVPRNFFRRLYVLSNDL